MRDPRTAVYDPTLLTERNPIGSVQEIMAEAEERLQSTITGIRTTSLNGCRRPR